MLGVVPKNALLCWNHSKIGVSGKQTETLIKHGQILWENVWSKYMLLSGPSMLPNIIGPDINL